MATRLLVSLARAIGLDNWGRPHVGITPEPVREALFAIIGRRIHDARFLDLFAGTGSAGIEALSRGAERCTFVESSSHLVNLIRRNLHAKQLTAQAEIIYFDAFDTIRTLHNRQHLFQFAFADPPRRREETLGTLELFDRYPLLRPGGLFFLHHSGRIELPPPQAALLVDTSESVGETALTVFRLRANPVVPG